MTPVKKPSQPQSSILRVAGRVLVAVTAVAAAVAVAPSASAETTVVAESIEVGVRVTVQTDPGDWPWLKPTPC